MSSAYREAAGNTSAETAVSSPPAEVASPAIETKRLRFSLSGARSSQTFSPLRHRDYALLWSGAAIMSAGQWLQQITLSWLVYDMSGSAFQLGLINGLRTLPYLIIGLFSGTIADRMDRRLLMLLTQLYLVAITSVMAVLLVSGRSETWHLFVYSFASGAGWAFVWPVRQAVIPTLVPEKEMMSAMALMMSALNFTRLIGPAIGGILLATLGGGGNFTVQAVLYAAVILMIVTMRIPPVPQAESNRDKSVLGSTIEGLRYVKRNDLVMGLLVLMLVPMTLAMPYMSLLAIFAKDVYHIGETGLGILLSFGGLGSLVGTLALASAGNIKNKGLLMMLTLTGMGATLIMFSWAPWLPLAIVFLMLTSAFQVTFLTVNQAVLQASISDDMRGRIASLYMLQYGFIPLGTLAAGAMADFIGTPVAIAIMGATVTAIGLIALSRNRTLRQV